MIETISAFFEMNGHGSYVFSAYGAVLIFLAWQYFNAYTRFQQYKKSQQQK